MPYILMQDRERETRYCMCWKADIGRVDYVTVTVYRMFIKYCRL